MKKPALVYSVDRQVCEVAGNGNALHYAVQEAADLLKHSNIQNLEEGELIVLTVGVMSVADFEAMTAPAVAPK